MIQEECPGSIRVAILLQTLDGQKGYEFLHKSLGQENKVVGEVFLPKMYPGNKGYILRIYHLCVKWLKLLNCLDMMEFFLNGTDLTDLTRSYLRYLLLGL